MKGSPAPFPVLITAASDMMGLARLPRVLSRAGCRVTLVAPDNLLVARSRYVERKVSAPPGPDNVAEALRRHLEAAGSAYVWTIIGDEALLRELSLRRTEEWVRAIFPVDPAGEGPDMIASKTVFAEAASRAGIAVPPFRVVRTPDEARETAGEIGFPLVIKEPYGSAGIEVRIVPDLEGVSPAFGSLKTDQPLLMQAFVPGAVGSTEVLYGHGRPLCWNSTYTVETFPAGTGGSCVRKVMVHPGIEPIVRETGRLLGFHGFGGIDWIHDRERDTLKVIEFNPRPTPGYHLAPFGGVDFSRAVHDMLEGKESIQKPCLADGQGAVVSMFPQYLNRLVDSRSAAGIVKWLFGRSPLKDIPFDDPGLLCALLRRVWLKFVKDVKKAVRRRFSG